MIQQHLNGIIKSFKKHNFTCLKILVNFHFSLGNHWLICTFTTNKNHMQTNKADRHKSRASWTATDRPTDRRTDRPTDRVAYRVACTRLKKKKKMEKEKDAESKEAENIDGKERFSFISTLNPSRISFLLPVSRMRALFIWAHPDMRQRSERLLLIFIEKSYLLRNWNRPHAISSARATILIANLNYWLRT